MKKPSLPSPFHWVSGAGTHVGKVRSNQVNEDAFLSLPDKGLWVVADGMGGYEAGEIASQAIIDALNIEQVPSKLSVFVNDIETRLLEVNKQLHDRTLKRSKVMGSTVVTLLTVAGHYVVMWTGDSRAYRYRNDKLKQLTQDHSQVQELIDKGFLAPAEAKNYPQNIITRAIGAQAEVFIDLDCVEKVQNGDVFLLCSDGLYNEIEESKIISILAKTTHNNCQKIANALIQSVLQGAAKDNITAVIIHAQQNK